MIFKRLPVHRRTGNEPFRTAHSVLPFQLIDFWRWSGSDLLNNAQRGVIAEYLVAQALGIADGVRTEWASYDLMTPSGLTIEVKSAAFHQTWGMSRLSSIVFNIRPTQAWDPETKVYSAERRRQADIYVFALLKHLDRETVDPLDVDQWEFALIPTQELNERVRTQQTISLGTLRKAKPIRSTWEQLPAAIESVAATIGVMEY